MNNMGTRGKSKIKMDMFPTCRINAPRNQNGLIFQRSLKLRTVCFQKGRFDGLAAKTSWKIIKKWLSTGHLKLTPSQSKSYFNLWLQVVQEVRSTTYNRHISSRRFPRAVGPAGRLWSRRHRWRPTARGPRPPWAALWPSRSPGPPGKWQETDLFGVFT